MPEVDDRSRSLVALDQDSMLLVVVELSQSSWLAAAMVPGIERRPLKKLEPDPAALLGLLERWRSEAEKAGRQISRIVLAFEAGRDGFWLARWLGERGTETYVVHLRIPTEAGRGFRFEVGRHSDVKPATVPI